VNECRGPTTAHLSARGSPGLVAEGGGRREEGGSDFAPRKGSADETPGGMAGW
jgi:hypothetical protein